MILFIVVFFLLCIYTGSPYGRRISLFCFFLFVSSFSLLLNRLLLFCLFFALQHCLVLLPVLVSLAFILHTYYVYLLSFTVHTVLMSSSQ